MNVKKYVTGSLVVFVAIFALDFFFHGFLMSGQYEAIKHILRADDSMMTYMPAMLLGDLIIAFTFCYVFIKGREGKGIAEGIRYGLIIGFGFGVGSALITYAVYPLTGYIMLSYFIGYPVMMAIHGAIIAAIYKPATA